MNSSVSTMTGKIKLKIVFLGNQSTGKSSIIQRYIHDRFDQTSNPTVGIDFLAKNVTHQSKTYRLQLWDTAGQQRFRSLIPNYLKDAQYAFIIFDVTNQKSLEGVQEWIKLYNQNKTIEGQCILIANKIDLPREIPFQVGKKKAQMLEMPYFQISAKTGDKIHDVFKAVLEIQHKKLGHNTTNILNNNVPQRPSFKKRQNSSPSSKQIPIKEQKQQYQDQIKNKSQFPDQTAAKIQDQQNPPQKRNQNIVLNKQSINKVENSKNQQNKKGCC